MRQLNEKRGGKEAISGGTSRQQKEGFRFSTISNLMEEEELNQVAIPRNTRVTQVVGKGDEKRKGKEAVKVVVERKNKQKESCTIASISSEKEESRRMEKQQENLDIIEAQINGNLEGGLGGYEQNFPEAVRFSFQSRGGDRGRQSDDGGQTGMQRGNGYKEARCFDWGLPRKPLNPPRKVNRKDKLQSDINGKRALSPSMEELVKKRFASTMERK